MSSTSKKMVLVSLTEEHPLAKKHLELILSRCQRFRLINGGLKGMLKRALMEGHIWIRSKYLTQNSGDKRSTADDSFPMASTDALTSQQLRVLKLVRENLSNKQIASELSISERTVEFYLRNIFLALNISSRYAVRDLLPTLSCPPGQPALDPQFPPSPRQ